MRASKNNKRNGRSKRRNVQKQELLSHPRQINGTELRHSMTMRFVSTAAFTSGITFQNLLDTFLVATSAITAADVFQTVKVRRVQLWAAPALGTATSVFCEFGGTTTGITGDQMIHSDTSMGIQPAHVSCAPSSKALASDYQVSSGANAFTIRGPAGTVIDVEMSFRGQFILAVAAQNATVGATLGAFYLRGLDGLATATSNFPPELLYTQI